MQSSMLLTYVTILATHSPTLTPHFTVSTTLHHSQTPSHLTTSLSNFFYSLLLIHLTNLLPHLSVILKLYASPFTIHLTILTTLPLHASTPPSLPHLHLTAHPLHALKNITSSHPSLNSLPVYSTFTNTHTTNACKSTVTYRSSLHNSLT